MCLSYFCNIYVAIFQRNGWLETGGWPSAGAAPFLVEMLNGDAACSWRKEIINGEGPWVELK